MYYVLGIVAIMIFFYFISKPKEVKTLTDEPEAEHEEAPNKIASDCCGAHEICEFDEAIFKQDEIIYFDDEELDVLRNVREDQFTASQIDDLREVLYTLRPNEIASWLISIGRRHIHLPRILQQEARQLMAEQH